MDNKQKILSFLQNQPLTVISTVDQNNQPQGAVIGFAIADDFTLIFSTESVTRKYQNIQKNPKVSFTFGGENRMTVQYQGNVVPFKDGEEEEYRELYLRRIPAAKKYDVRPKNVYLKVAPTWIRYSDFTKDPYDEFEIAEF